MLVLPVSEAEDRVSFAIQHTRVLRRLQPVHELMRVVRRLALAVRRHGEELERGRHVVIIKVFEVDDLGIKTSPIRFVRDGLGVAFGRARLAAEVDLHATVGGFALLALFITGCSSLSPLRST